MNTKFTDNSAEYKRKVEDAVEAALEAMAIHAQSHAVKNLKDAGRGGGKLAKSITHRVKKSEAIAYVGTNTEYAIYNEFGTGIYAANGNGRKTPWVYKDDEGDFHTTRGITPTHFLKNAIAGYEEEYNNIAKSIIQSLF